MLCRLQPQYSVPLGVLGIVVMVVLKQAAGAIPLPRGNRQLAAGLGAAVMFVLGVAEEVWRWGLVRVLVTMEGGKGGFRGSGEPWDLAVGPASAEHPSIWEAVYLMGWVWSLVECVVRVACAWRIQPSPLH